MTAKPLAEMSFDELKAERAAAQDAILIADYQEGLSAWVEAKRTARERLARVNAEFEQRFDQLIATAKEQKNV